MEMGMITIDDKEYDIEAMTDEQKLLIGQIQNCKAKGDALRVDLDMIQVALNAYVNALKEGLAEEDQDTTD
jgi:hypothetical protein